MMLMAAFFGANFVALVFLTWMPTFLTERFHLNLAKAGFGATFYIQTASMIGAMAGGWIADRWRRSLPGGRMLSQALGALLGGPFIYLCGFTRNLTALIVAMTLFGLTKGLYDANIWASLYDVVPGRHRGAAVGVANMIGWLGGGLGAYFIGRAVTRWHFTMSQAISSTATIYLGVAALLLVAGFVFAPRDIRAAEAGTA
jgi:MFS family permease